MNKFEQYLVSLLQGNISIDGQNVEVVKHYSQHPTRPVITLDLSNGVTTQHVYNDPSVAEVYYERNATININVWCDTESQRQSICNQILDCFYMEQSYHYKYCTQYNSTTQKCSTTHSTCAASTTSKKRCPQPETLQYTPLYYSLGIIQGSITVDPPFELDELTEHPPILRSILRCSCQYSDTVKLPYVPVEDVVIVDPLSDEDGDTEETIPVDMETQP